MNIFAALKKYGSEYELKDKRDFEESEKAQVKSASVVLSTYGKSVCFIMKSGGQTYVPVSRDSVVNIGDTVDLDKAKILTLEKDGETINRIEI